MLTRLLTATALGTCLATAAAGDAALIISNGDYEELDDVSGGDRLRLAEDPLSEAGFDVIARADASSVEIVDALRQFLSRIDAEDERVVVALSGQFATSGEETYLLPVDAPAPFRLLDAQRGGVPLSLVLVVLAEHPGKALLILGEGREDGEAGPRLDYGMGALEMPQGVTLLRGAPGEVTEFARRALTRRGAPLFEEAGRFRLEVGGYAPRDYVFLPARGNVTIRNERGQPQDETEAELWAETQRRDTVEAYETYLRVFPEGRHAAQAGEAIETIRAEPGRDARIGEEALGLSRDARREIQRGLSILGYDTRGIDGIFGPGTRNAIGNWQEENGFSGTGYLTGNQIARLDDQAEDKATQLEEEARQRQAEQERRDRAFWQDTGAAGDEAGLRAYLKRYPDGVYAEVAQERLDEIEEEQRQQAAEADRRAWQDADGAGTVQAYRGYLRDFPEGAFAGEAQARIEEMTRPQEEVEAEQRAKAREDALGMNATTRRLVEDRLEKLGLKPGRVDGNFDLNTRRALRRYQQARNLQVTGYLDQDTVVRLLADAILR